MSNSDTASPYPDSYVSVGWRYSLDAIHEIAITEDRCRDSWGHLSTNNLLFELGDARRQRDNWREQASDDVPANDQRIEYIWNKLWDALDGDIERDETWGMFMDAIPGIPEFRKEQVSGSITLTFNFIDLEIDGGLTSYDRTQAILDVYEDEHGFDRIDADGEDVHED